MHQDLFNRQRQIHQFKTLTSVIGDEVGLVVGGFADRKVAAWKVQSHGDNVDGAQSVASSYNMSEI